MKGYIGKLLFVNVGTKHIHEEQLETSFCREYIGGYGLGARLLYSRQKGGVDALGPENTIGFITGPLTGTPTLFGNRCMVVAKAAKTGGWGDSNMGGDFGPLLKFAGYDGVFVTGISEKPVYLLISDGEVEIRDASNLWAKDTLMVHDLIKADLGNDVSIACIGQAGEKLSLIASVMSNRGLNTAGRTGLGAVMGSKKLKAVVVRGGTEVQIADSEKLEQFRKDQLALLKDSTMVDLWKKFGTTQVTAGAALNGHSAVKNWAGVGEIDFPDGRYIGDSNITQYVEHVDGCWHCPIRCKGRMKTYTGEYQWMAGIARPEHETLAALGTRCLNGNVPSLIKETDICNRYGLDTISTGAVLAFAIECYEEGIVTKQDTDGIELKWGAHQAHVAMIEKIAKREGFGDILADGVKLAAERIGKGAENYAVHIGGQEPPNHDPKENPGMATTYLMDAVPARHTRYGSALLEYKDRRWYKLGLGLEPLERYVYSGKGEGHRKMGAYFNVIQSSGVCFFPYLGIMDEVGHVRFLLGSLNAVTGFDYTLEELLKIGDRITTIQRAFNIREGINPLLFKVPGRLLGKPPMEIGPWKGIEIDLDTQVNDYLRAMDWDLKEAKPSQRVLEDLGLADIVQDI